MNIRPLHDRVIVKRKEAEKTTASGIIIPDTAKEKPQEGVVIAVGAGIRMENGSLASMEVKAGDKVLFEKYGGSDIKIDGEEVIMMKESNIIGILED